MAEATTTRKLLAEFVGTGALTFVGAGTTAATFAIGTATNVPTSMAQLAVIAFAFMLVIVAVVYSFGHISGAHINPAVTVALAAMRRFPWREVPGYLGAQFAGGVAGAAAIYATLGRASSEAGLGVTAYSPGVGVGRALFAELIGTFLLVLVVFGAVDRRAPGGWAGLAIGSIVFVVIIVAGPATGPGINPARYFGPMLVQQIVGGATFWTQLPVYLIAEFVGGALAGVMYVFVGGPKPDEVETAEGVAPDTATLEPGPTVPAG